MLKIKYPKLLNDEKILFIFLDNGYYTAVTEQEELLVFYQWDGDSKFWTWRKIFPKVLNLE